MRSEASSSGSGNAFARRNNRSNRAKCGGFIMSRILGCISLAIPLTACATTVVDIELSPEVVLTSPSGGRVSPQGRLFSSRPSAGAAMPFDTWTYETESFTWSIATGARGFGGTFTSKTDKDLCFRFDQVMLISNFQRTPEPLKVWSMSWTHGKGYQNVGSTSPKNRTLHEPPKVCIDGFRKMRVSLGVFLDHLFPAHYMFDVHWVEGESQLVREGVGNWLLVRLPVDYSDGKREIVEAKLIASRAKGRKSYF